MLVFSTTIPCSQLKRTTLMNTKEPQKNIERPPVVVVMGHVDHGKSALLDYIRKSNVVEGEAGGITQHISAYEVEHEHGGKKKKITFIDTPGHEAFGKMRARGAKVADIAILIVSAEDGVKRQTLEALEAIKVAGIPYVVAINKIDKPGANVTQTQSSLVENEIYIEGMGGDISWSAISAKTGEGVEDLLDTILLITEMEELTGEPSASANGVVVEAHRDPKSGLTATLLIKSGVLNVGDFVLAGTALTPVRNIEDCTGKKISSATFSSPVGITGFDELPKTGARFLTFHSKKEAEKVREKNRKQSKERHEALGDVPENVTCIPLVIKADVHGTLDAIEHELEKLTSQRVLLKVLVSEVGSISERDIQTAIGTGALVVGFNVKADTTAREAARQHGVAIHTFDIIYELAEWLANETVARTPKQQIEKEIGEAKLIKIFSESKGAYVLGAKVKSGVIKRGATLRVERRNEHVANAKITNLQSGKQAVEKVEEGAEFGAQVKADSPLVEGDKLKAYETVEE